MTHRHLFALCVIWSAYAPTATSQNNLGEIVVTGSRVSGDDYSGIPAITLDKRADFLVPADSPYERHPRGRCTPKRAVSDNSRPADGRVQEAGNGAWLWG